MHLLAFYLKVVRDREYEKSHYMEDFGYTLHIYAYLCIQVQPPSSTTSILEALILTLSSALGKKNQKYGTQKQQIRNKLLVYFSATREGALLPGSFDISNQMNEKKTDLMRLKSKAKVSPPTQQRGIC